MRADEHQCLKSVQPFNVIQMTNDKPIAKRRGLQIQSSDLATGDLQKRVDGSSVLRAEGSLADSQGDSHGSHGHGLQSLQLQRREGVCVSLRVGVSLGNGGQRGCRLRVSLSLRLIEVERLLLLLQALRNDASALGGTLCEE